MDDKYVKWGVWISLAFFILTIVFLGTYLLTPSIISALMGTPGNQDICTAPCNATGGPGSIGMLNCGLTNLCNQSKAFLGMFAMLFVIIGSFASLATCALTLIILLGDEKTEGNKAIYVLLLVFLGFIGAWIYLNERDRQKRLQWLVDNGGPGLVMTPKEKVKTDGK